MIRNKDSIKMIISNLGKNIKMLFSLLPYKNGSDLGKTGSKVTSANRGMTRFQILT